MGLHKWQHLKCRRGCGAKSIALYTVITLTLTFNFEVLILMHTLIISSIRLEGVMLTSLAQECSVMVTSSRMES